MTRCIIAGSRNFTDYQILEKNVMRVFELEHIFKPQIISGHARGTDMLGELFAHEHYLDLKTFPAQWEKYGKSAGPIRNNDMATYASEETGMLIAFWDGKSKGTHNMIDTAKKHGLTVYVIDINNKEN